jgi:RNA polymerase sigma factor (sigma-70 family)
MNAEMKAEGRELGKLIERIEPLLHSFIRKYNHGKYGIDGDDLLQEAEIRLWKVLENGHDIRFLSSYLDKVVLSIILGRSRQLDKERSASFSEELRGRIRGSFAPGKPAASTEAMKDAVRGTLDSLKEARRIVIELSLSGLSIQEIAENQGWTLKKTYNLYERGIKDIKTKLDKKGPRR